MKIVMISNYLNHHQLSLCEAFLHLGIEFTFIATGAMGSFRKKMGYADLNHSIPYVLNAHESPEDEEKSEMLCRTCDVMILCGQISNFRRLAKRSCIVFVYSEHIFKNRPFSWQNILRYCKYLPTWHYSTGARLLCASAYAARDYHLLGQYLNRAYKWGYFPETREQKVELLLDRKEPSSIIWVGRFLSWKHPETAIAMAERLKQDDIPFSLTMVGDGNMREELELLVARKGLTSSVHFLGFIPPDEVRTHMERSLVHLFTSDHGEGWGAVLNESMNSCCVVIANREIGSVPYLIEDSVNGFNYSPGDEDGLYHRLKSVLTGPESYRIIAQAAYETVQNDWNAEIAADRLITLANALSEGKDSPFKNGICSKA